MTAVTARRSSRASQSSGGRRVDFLALLAFFPVSQLPKPNAMTEHSSEAQSLSGWGSRTSFKRLTVKGKKM